MTFDFLSAFAVGLLGSGHCLGMCGGITTLLTSAIQQPNGKHYHYLWLYHLGRILSYSVIGFIVAYTAAMTTKNIGLPLGYLRLLSALFIILLGLYIGQWYLGLTKIEKIGQKFWQLISPLSKKVMPVNSVAKAFGLGVLWGWLPCGLVYSMLTWAIASNNAWQGAGIMASFGLGTLPSLLLAAIGVTKSKQLLANILFKQIIASLLIVYGIYSFTVAYSMLFL
jgi:hypothetical protein